jgi:hypothetical protein
MIDKEKEDRIESNLAYVLAKTYVRIPWKQIGVKSAHTFFIDRVRASSGSRNIKEFMEQLQKKVQVSFVDVETEHIDLLEENKAIALRLLRKETNYIVMLALEQVEGLREQMKLKSKGQSTLGDG